jgi:hypothetical protein
VGRNREASRQASFGGNFLRALIPGSLGQGDSFVKKLEMNGKRGESKGQKVTAGAKYKKQKGGKE